MKQTSDAMERDNNLSISMFDGSLEAKKCRECCSSSSSRSLVNTIGNIGDVISNVPTSFSEKCSGVDVNHDGWFETTTTMDKLIM